MTERTGFLNRNQLKYLVIAAMLIDHIAWAFVPTASLLGQAMHIVGRLTGPTMAYMLAEGYHYTRNVKKYALRLGIFAVISWLPFSYFERGCICWRSGSGTRASVRFCGNSWGRWDSVFCRSLATGRCLMCSMR